MLESTQCLGRLGKISHAANTVVDGWGMSVNAEGERRQFCQQPFNHFSAGQEGAVGRYRDRQLKLAGQCDGSQNVFSQQGFAAEDVQPDTAGINELCQ